MNHQIIVPRWGVRRLDKGCTWQRHRLPCSKFPSETQFPERFGGRMAEMRAGYDRFLRHVMACGTQPCRHLGLELATILQRLCEHPKPSKALQATLWKARQARFLLAAWIHRRGPVPEAHRREGCLPLEGFGPPPVRQIHDIAELIDAPKLTLIERGRLPAAELYDGV